MTRASLAKWAAAAALLPLRLFLGATFVFAGLQKLANPDFFNRSSPISISSQLAGAERTSPLHALLGHLLGVATPLGAAIAVSEVAIGIGVLFGLLARTAAIGGMLLSFGLFLTVSFRSTPYYTGADIVFFFAFTPLLLGGPGELLALDPLVRRRAAELAQKRRHRALAGRAAGTRARPAAPTGLGTVTTRRVLFAKVAGATASVAVVAMGLDSLIGRLLSGARSAPVTASLGGGSAAPATSLGPGAPSSSPVTSSPVTSAAAGATSTSSTTPHPPGVAVGLASQVPVGGAAMFQDPASGDPGIVVQQATGHFVAFDAVCPHAGCTVGYSSANNLIVCPCHGSEFDPSTGAVIAGPAPRGLRPIQISEAGNGELYAV